MPIDTTYLNTTCYFRDLPSDALADISRHVFEKRFPAGETMLWEGEQEDKLYFIISGLVRLFATSADGREFVVRVAYGGDSINDDAIFSHGPNLLSATSMSPVLFYGIPREDLNAILRTHPVVGNRVTEVLAERQRYLVKLSTELVFKNVTGRLARLLLEQDQMLNGNAKDLRITQREMAAMVGTVREIVSRSLHEMELMNAVALEHNQIVIKNRQILQELVGV